ncbi:ADP-ribosylation factor-like protein 6-interacting protein 6 isoform X1 [Corythoichthys intestinalis]|uniref:ADP-ribosylation factor-like protein 6-interacting protein 6 isoform X1 n=1 Tax=Corythoichthys intestinalis TaxID=161448 RepID=UPI0025A65F18|nr:ADP-ribosylation factor-like protein 6-interacting protein 6 isoform X1 [Corythoichthys intestinalis]
MEHRSQSGAVVKRSSVKHRLGFKPWTVVVASVVVSALVVAAVGVLCALLDPILQELRAGRVKEESGAEARMLGFWSILVLSIFAGLSCCFFSWTLIYLNSYKPGTVPPTLLTLLCRDKNNKDLLLDYGVAVLNGSMATLAVIWNLI